MLVLSVEMKLWPPLIIGMRAFGPDGKVDAAIAELKRAYELDPLSLIINLAVDGFITSGSLR